MRTVQRARAKTHLSRLLDDVEAVEEFVLARAGRPCARLVPLDQPTERRLGFVKGVITSAFFDPLDDEELATWE